MYWLAVHQPKLSIQSPPINPNRPWSLYNNATDPHPTKAQLRCRLWRDSDHYPADWSLWHINKSTAVLLNGTAWCLCKQCQETDHRARSFQSDKKSPLENGVIILSHSSHYNPRQLQACRPLINWAQSQPFITSWLHILSVNFDYCDGNIMCVWVMFIEYQYTHVHVRFELKPAMIMRHVPLYM